MIPTPISDEMRLAHGLTFSELYHRDGLIRLDGLFLEHLRAADPDLAARLVGARTDPAALDARAHSDLLITVAPHLERFIARLFGIETEVQALAAKHHQLAPLYQVKRQFVQRRAMHRYPPHEAAGFDGLALERELEQAFGEPFTELAFARHVTKWQKDESAHVPHLERALRYAAWAAHSEEGRKRCRGGVLFKAPAKLDPQRLITGSYR